MIAIRGVIGPLLIRFSSLAIMGYSILFLFIVGGAADVGALSGVFAITAPVVMFLMFRYVESLSLSRNKPRDFSLHCLVALGGYGIAIPAIWAVVLLLKIDPLAALCLLIFKPFEILSDLLVTMFVSTGRVRRGQMSSLLRLLCVIVISFVAWRCFSLDPLMAVAIGLLAAFSAIFLFVDLPCAVSSNFFTKVSYGEVRRFIRDNSRFGVLGLINSAGSSLPRFFVGFSAGLAALGIFSVLYQVSATAVNVLQYPISLHAGRVAIGVRDSRFVVWLMGAVGGGAVLLAILVLLESIPPIEEDLSWRMVGVYSLLVFLMFVALLLRGVLVSTVIALKRANAIQFTAVAAIGLAVVVALPIFLIADASSQVYGAVAFVMASCGATAGLLLIRVGKWS